MATASKGPSYQSIYQPIANAAAAKYGVPQDLFARLIESESSWDPKAPGALLPDGDRAFGIAQFRIGTAKDWGVDRTDPTSSLVGAAKYLAYLKSMYGSWKAAVAKYKGYSSLDRGMSAPDVLKVVDGSAYAPIIESLTSGGQKSPVEITAPKTDDKGAAVVNDKAFWQWGIEDLKNFFANTAIGFALFVVGLLLILFTVYAMVSRGKRATIAAVPELKGAFSRGSK